jgi:hypothetical protein
MLAIETPKTEARMDFHNLVAGNLPPKRRPVMEDRAEDRYYRDHASILRPSLQPLASIATAAGLILLLIGVAQA